MYSGFIIFLRYTVFLIIDFNFELAFIKPTFFMLLGFKYTHLYETQHFKPSEDRCRRSNIWNSSLETLSPTLPG